MSNPLGTKIRRLRKSKKWTLDTLAQRAGLSKSYLWNLENAKNSDPSARVLLGMATALGTKMEDDESCFQS